jgi:hypothetical protein
MLGVFQYLMGLIFLIDVNKFHLDVLDLDMTLQVSVFGIVVAVVVVI